MFNLDVRVSFYMISTKSFICFVMIIKRRDDFFKTHTRNLITSSDY